MSRRRIVSIDVSTGSYVSFVERIVSLGSQKRSSYVCVANVHMTVEARRDASFAAMVNGADLVTPDGMPLAIAMRLLHGMKQERAAGMDLFPDLLAAAESSGLSVFLYGSKEQVLAAVIDRISREFPRLKVAGSYSPPFRPLADQEAAEEVSFINRSGAHIVLVALGCPKQERWMAGNQGRIDAVMVGIGGALPVYAGLQKRAPRLMQRLSLEWFYRLCQEPRRLFRRYLVTNTIFLLLLVRCYLRRLVAPVRGPAAGKGN